MAKVILNPNIGKISGRIGDLVFYSRNGTTSVRPRPARSNMPPTAAQREHQVRFTQAAAYARAAHDDPVQWAFYTAIAHENSTTAYAEAVSDFLRPPVVTDICVDEYRGRPGDAIIIRAEDRHEVTAVTVTIRDSANVVVETGAAHKAEDGGVRTEDGAPANGKWQRADSWRTCLPGAWVYQAKAKIPPGQSLSVEAAAHDRPGHVGTAVVAYVSPSA